MKKAGHATTAYEHIRKGILNGVYQPGQPLLEAELAKKTGVSRTPVREALRQLESEGLITLRANIGATVKSMTMREYREMSEMRQALESAAAGLAALHRSDEDMKAIAAPFHKMEAAVKTLAGMDEESHTLLREVIREDIKFHLAILSAAGNELMKREILRLHLIKRVVATTHPDMARIQPSPSSEKARRDARRAESLARHRRVFEAIRSGDALAAKTAMEQHIQEVIDLSLLAMARAKEPTPVREPSEEELEYMS